MPRRRGDDLVLHTTISFVPAPPPATKLGRYRQLAPRAAIHVSPLPLGGLSIGDKWAAAGAGAMDKQSSFKLLDAYFDAGGERIKSCYTNLGKVRDDSLKQKNLYMGNNVKSLKLRVEESLRRLRTTYIDILYVHYWDLHTSVGEIMDSLHNLVVMGKVLYLGISDSPAWFVVEANEYAKANGKTLFVLYQAPYSERTDDEKKMCAVLEHVANQFGVKHITAGKDEFTLSTRAFVYPIIGGRKIEQLMANIEALDITLTADHVTYIESILAFDKGFPTNIIGEYDGPAPFLLSLYATWDRQPLLPPIPPARTFLPCFYFSSYFDRRSSFSSKVRPVPAPP
ncbi:aryl-alcohol dehydrogenase [Mycena vulgaris]|nr:aryl-alcohol dehydrogenase [Mycena vulgaris]